MDWICEYLCLIVSNAIEADYPFKNAFLPAHENRQTKMTAFSATSTTISTKDDQSIALLFSRCYSCRLFDCKSDYKSISRVHSFESKDQSK